MSTPEPSLRFSVFFCRLLVALYPPRFRRRFGHEMLADFEAILRQNLDLGPLRGRCVAWWQILGDSLFALPREHFHALLSMLRGEQPKPASLHMGPVAILASDLVAGLRPTRRQPGFALLMVITFGLGIGAATTIFVFLDGVLLRPLPFPEADRLVYLQELTPEGKGFSMSEPNYLDFRERARSLEVVAAMTMRTYPVLGGDQPLEVDGAAVSASFFEVLGMSAARGRVFVEAEDIPGGDPDVIVLSEALWQRLGADPDLVGGSLVVGGRERTVVGVMPEGFGFPMGMRFWEPLGADPASSRGNHELKGIGLLREGVSVRTAALEIEAIAAELSTAHPESNGGWGARLRPLEDWLVRSSFRRTLVVLQVGVGILLLMAAASVSNLLWARANRRRGELALRRALGASPSRLLRQALAESLFLALAGGALGCWLTIVAVPLLIGMAPSWLPRLDEVSVDTSTLLFALVASASTALLAGGWPAWRAVGDSGENAFDSARMVSTRSERSTSDILVVAETIFATLLLVGAVVLVGSFLRLGDTDPGFATEGVVSVPLSLTGESYSSAERVRLLAEIESRLLALPGVESVGATNIRPFQGNTTAIEMHVPSRSGAPSEYFFVDWRSVTAGYFRSLDIPILDGRSFDASDGLADGGWSAVVSRTFAESQWPGESAIGQQVAFGTGTDLILTVIGVSGDIHDVRLGDAPNPVVFLSHERIRVSHMNLLLRTELPAAVLADSVRAAIWSVAPELPIPEVVPFDRHVREAMALSRLAMLLMAVFAGVALTMVVLATHGVVASAVSRRQREIGLRLALGAGHRQILGLVVGQGMKRVLLGVGLGLFVAHLASRYLEAMVHGAEAGGPEVYAAVALALVVLAIPATYLPARRALGIGPRAALDSDRP